ncbi:transporter substrate-binding domain-containing protein [Halioxenophilus sp. WMMB6]|uniref:transporter substrate-binding domain-containing protein n=1 Tax=Halioxenophilus sp. WMMB6 TaxID=3073815 RepID=UPI00295F510E|nr:transporter substrate-binding domain-containing protein [Halioxenophilus sp. WMMB6]
MPWRWFLICPLFCILPTTLVQAAEAVVLWNRNFDTAPVDKVLSLALRKTEDLFGAAEIVRSADMGPQQALAKLAAGDELNVVSMATSPEADANFYTLRFPALQGLLGHRICLIRQGDQARFDAVATGYDLIQKKIAICQGESWPDTQVLRRNGLQVITSPSYNELFNLLQAGQCDCFLRGAQELVPEYRSHADSLAIEQHLVIHYFQPGVIYVNRQHPELAARLELGLLRAWDDGSYQQLFDELLGEDLKLLDLPNRHYIPLNNPYLSGPAQLIQSLEPTWSMPTWTE